MIENQCKSVHSFRLFLYRLILFFYGRSNLTISHQSIEQQPRHITANQIAANQIAEVLPTEGSGVGVGDENHVRSVAVVFSRLWVFSSSFCDDTRKNLFFNVIVCFYSFLFCLFSPRRLEVREEKLKPPPAPVQTIRRFLHGRV